MKDGIMTQQRYLQNQKTMESVAFGLPIITPQGSVTFTEDILNNAIENIESAARRLNSLLAK